jgi:hypothetical protein
MVRFSPLSAFGATIVGSPAARVVARRSVARFWALGVVVAAVLTLSGGPARAEDRLVASVQWWTNVSDSVVVAEVSGTKELQIPSVDWKSQQVQFKTKTVLKGQRIADVSISQDYLDIDRFFKGKELLVDHPLQTRDEVLLFCTRRDEKSPPTVIFWTNLSRPDPEVAKHAPNDNTAKALGDRAAILAAVKGRIEKEGPAQPAKSRGLLINFPRLGWECFVRTADAEYKPVLVGQLKGGSKQESAIYNLISYPGKETRDLLTPFLKDPTKFEANAGKDGAKVTVFPLRQMAFTALALLGESAPRPEGYWGDWLPWQFGEWFENRLKFPYGDWKRLDFPAPPTEKQGTVPPESIARVTVADLPKSLEQVCSEEKANYHRLLWRAYHLAHNSAKGRPWADVGPVLDRLQVTRLSSNNYQLGTAYSYRMKPKGFTTANGLAHDLVVVFHVGDESTEDKPTVRRVFRVDVNLVATVKKPFAELARAKPYPRDTIAVKVLEAPGAIDAAKSCPIVEKIEIGYTYLFDRWAEHSPHGFDVTLTLIDRRKDPTASKSLNARVTSGLDPEQDFFGEKVLAGFRSQDTLDEVGAAVGGGWESGGDRFHSLERIGSDSFASADEDWAEVYSWADVRALPRSTRRVRIMEGKFAAQALATLADLPMLEKLEVEDDGTTDDDLATIARFRALKGLSLHSKRISDAGIAKLTGLKALEGIALWASPRLTDECCQSLGQMKSLKRLYFGYECHLTIKGVRALSGLTDLEGCDFGGIGGDEGLEVVGRLGKLKSLHIGHSKTVTAKGFEHLTKLSGLRSLSIGFSEVNDECLRHVGKIESLEMLRLFELPITDAGLKHLTGLKNLNYLDISDSPKVTDAGLAELQSKLPGKFTRK